MFSELIAKTLLLSLNCRSWVGCRTPTHPGLIRLWCRNYSGVDLD